MGRSAATVRDYGGTAARFLLFAERVPAELDPVLRYVASRRERLAPAHAQARAGGAAVLVRVAADG